MLFIELSARSPLSLSRPLSGALITTRWGGGEALPRSRTPADPVWYRTASASARASRCASALLLPRSVHYAITTLEATNCTGGEFVVAASSFLAVRECRSASECLFVYCLNRYKYTVVEVIITIKCQEIIRLKLKPMLVYDSTIPTCLKVTDYRIPYQWNNPFDHTEIVLNCVLVSRQGSALNRRTQKRRADLGEKWF